jgi:hypothetical protein
MVLQTVIQSTEIAFIHHPWPPIDTHENFAMVLMGAHGYPCVVIDITEVSELAPYFCWCLKFELLSPVVSTEFIPFRTAPN